MIIELASLGNAPKPITKVFAPDEIDLDALVEAAGNIAFDGNVFSDDRGVHLTGGIEGEIRLECSRCLEPVTKRLTFEFEDIFVLGSAETFSDELEVAEDQLKESTPTNRFIDLAEVVREQVLLEIPEQIFCKEDCKGLCPVCGTDRNLLVCNCDNNEIDPRWAALKNLN